MQSDRIKQAQDILKMVNQAYVTPAEVKVVFEAIRSAILTIKSTLSDKDEELDQKIGDLTIYIKSIETSLDKRLVTLESLPKTIKNIETQLTKIVSDCQMMMKEMTDDDSVDMAAFEDMRANFTLQIQLLKKATAEEIRTQVQSIKPFDPAIIQDLNDKIDQINKKIEANKGSGGITIGGNRPVAVFANGTQVGGAVTRFNFTNATVTSPSTSGKQVNITTTGGSAVYATGHGVPNTTPATFGAGYIDLDSANIYIAAGTSSSADWKLVAAY